MSEFSIRNIILHRFQVDNNEGETCIGYCMIIGRNMIVQLGLSSEFKCRVLQWDGVTVTIKETRGLMGQTYLTCCNMCEVVMQTTEPVYTREATKRLVKILNSTYEKAYLEQVASSANQMKNEERTQILRLLKQFEDLFDGNLGDWYTEPFDLELKPYSEPFNCKYYMVTIINKVTFHKELQRLEKIGVLTLVQQYQYGTPIFVIPKKEGTVRFITDYLSIKHKLVINLYPLPKIGNKINQLEGFQYGAH